MDQKYRSDPPQNNGRTAITKMQRMRLLRNRKLQKTQQNHFYLRAMSSYSQLFTERKSKTSADRMRLARKRQQKAKQNLINAMNERRRLYRAKIYLQLMSQSSEQSNSLPSQDQSVDHDNNYNSDGELLTQIARRNSPSRFLLMPRHKNQGNVVYEKYLITNDNGRVCTVWYSTKPKEVSKNGINIQNIKKEVNSVDGTEEPETDLFQATTSDSNNTITSTFDPIRQIKIEPPSDDEVAHGGVSTMETTPPLTPAVKLEDTDNECSAYGKFIEYKLKTFSQQTRNAVQHAFGNIIFNASQGHYEQN